MAGTWTHSGVREPAGLASAGSPDAEPTLPPANTPEPDTPAAGTRAPIGREQPGRYRILRELARGGQGIVYVAWDEHLGREVAFKQVLAPQRAGHASGAQTPGGSPTPSGPLTPAEARFVREARITAQLDHPGIAPVHEVGRRDDGSLYSTQKLVRGRTLAAALDGCKTLRDRMALLQPLLGICQAVAYAHERGVIHRDLKPGNMLLGDLGEAVVLDWGLGRTRDEPAAARAITPPVDSLLATDAGRTLEGALIGTPSYMSPEQAVGATAAVDARTDVWSLGVILYELLTGRRPFQGASSEEVLRAVATAPLTPVREACPDAPPELAEVAERALRRDPAARYPSAKELARDLSAWLSGGRVVAHEYSSLELVRRFVVRNKALSVLLLALFTVVQAGTVILFARSREQEHQLAQGLIERSRAAAQQLRWNEAAIYGAAARLHQDTAEARWAAAQVGAVEVALAAHWRIAAGLGEANDLAPDGSWFLLNRPARKVDAATGKLLPFEGAPLQCDVFGDGSALPCFAAGGKAVQVASAADGKLRWKSADGARPTSHALSPDGRTLALGRADGQLALLDAATGAERGASQRQAKPVSSVFFSPDGSKLVTTGGEVAVWDLATGARLAAFESDADAAWLLPDGRLAYSSRASLEIREVGAAAPAWKAKGWSSLFPAAHCSGNANLVVAPIEAGVAEGESILWDLRLRRPIARLPGWAGGFSSDCGRLLTWNPLDRLARLWRIGETTWRGIGAPGRLARFSFFTPRGHVVWLDVDPARSESTLRMVDPASGRELASAGPDKGFVQSASASPDGALIAELYNDQTTGLSRVRVRSADDLASLSTIEGHRYGFTNAAGGMATASRDGIVRLWDARTGRLEKQLATSAVPGGVNLAFSPDGRRLAIPDGNGVHLWDLVAGAPLGWLRSARALNAVWADFTASGRLYFLDDDEIMSFLPADRRDQPFAHTSPFGQWDASADRRVLALVAHDLPTLWDRDRVTLWDLETGEHLLDIPQSVPGDLGISRDGLAVAVVTGADPPVIVLPVRPPEQGLGPAEELARRLQLPTRTLVGTEIVERPPVITPGDQGAPLSQRPVNPGFEEGDAGKPPPGWSAGEHLEAAPPVTSAERPFAGARCARIEVLRPPSRRISAQLSQAIDARPYRGRTIRLRVALRAEVAGSAHASPLLRVARSALRLPFNEWRRGAHEDLPVTSPEWRIYELRARVAEDADHIDFGAFLAGAGKAWIDEVSIDAIE